MPSPTLIAFSPSSIPPTEATSAEPPYPITLAEKDVTLGFARLLRHELEIRGFAVTLLRDADTTLTLDQRATAANIAHAGIYISLHATSQGSGARVYTSLLPVEAPSKGIFHAWNAAQSPTLAA